jgi:hypothetical protein
MPRGQYFPTDLPPLRGLFWTAMAIDSTVLIAAVLIGVLAILVFFPFDKL